VPLTVERLDARDWPDDVLDELFAGAFPPFITAGPASRPGPSGSATVQMWSAADPRDFTLMEITAEGAGDGHQRGQVVLSGTTHQ
jgi:hypothetical protein